MIEDAHTAGFNIQKRTIHSWIAHGLLDKPSRRGAGRGSRPGLHSASQRELFLLLLSKREKTTKLSDLALIPLAIWLWSGDDWVPSRQAVKAFMTWFRNGGEQRKDLCRDSALKALEQIDHPLASQTARNRFVRLFEEAAYRGRVDATERQEFEKATRAVFEPPSVFHSTGMARAIGPHAMPITADTMLERIFSEIEGLTVIRDVGVSERLLRQARVHYCQTKLEYAEIRPALFGQSADSTSEMFVERTVQEEFNNVGRDLTIVIGALLMFPQAQEALDALI
ncbi:hypothetical protein ACF06V_25815 [Streptomyces bobili]|uniref:hypothetical protein n=1 Tax=Streptomyces bobili TaxID=67280 RepID=UPI003700CC5C